MMLYWTTVSSLDLVVKTLGVEKLLSLEEHLCRHLSPLKSWLRFVFSFSMLFTTRFLASWLRKEPKTFHFRIINPWKPSAASDISLQRKRNKMLLFYYGTWYWGDINCMLFVLVAVWGIVDGRNCCDPTPVPANISINYPFYCYYCGLNEADW